MNTDLPCIIHECESNADGLVVVNHEEPEITIFMIPACKAHAETMQHTNFTIELRFNEPPVITMGESLAGIKPDLTLRFEAF